MFKRLVYATLALLLAPIVRVVEGLLASPAEFGSQMVYPGLAAAADLSGKQYCFVRNAALGTINLASEVGGVSGANKRAIGVLQNKPKSGEPGTVAYMGQSKILAGGTVTVNGLITYNSSGKAVDAVSGDIVCGVAMEGTTVDGTIVSAMLLPPVRWGSVA